MKKFEFTGESKTIFGLTLKRIRALIRIDLGWTVINPGDLGGWLEKESNLSHEGKAWVWGNAKVWGNAEVCGDAFIFRAEHLLVMGAMGSRNAFTSFFRNKKGEIKVKCGCFFGTVDQFLSKVAETHGDSKHAIVYRAAVTVALAQLDTTPFEGDEDASR